jgi:hypothetical protein
LIISDLVLVVPCISAGGPEGGSEVTESVNKVTQSVSKDADDEVSIADLQFINNLAAMHLSNKQVKQGTFSEHSANIQ